MEEREAKHEAETVRGHAGTSRRTSRRTCPRARRRDKDWRERHTLGDSQENTQRRHRTRRPSSVRTHSDATGHRGRRPSEHTATPPVTEAVVRRQLAAAGRYKVEGIKAKVERKSSVARRRALREAPAERTREARGKRQRSNRPRKNASCAGREKREKNAIGRKKFADTQVSAVATHVTRRRAGHRRGGERIAAPPRGERIAAPPRGATFAARRV